MHDDPGVVIFALVTLAIFILCVLALAGWALWQVLLWVL